MNLQWGKETLQGEVPFWGEVAREVIPPNSLELAALLPMPPLPWPLECGLWCVQDVCHRWCVVPSVSRDHKVGGKGQEEPSAPPGWAWHHN